MLKRIKNLIKLSGVELTKREGEFFSPPVIQGDGKAEFLEDMTEEDFVEYEKEQSGWKGWLKRHGL